MKRIALISLAAFAAFVSCQKAEMADNSQAMDTLVFTASIAADGTKTSLSDDAEAAKIYWEAGDKITIIDALKDTAVYKLSAGAGTTSGTFVYESGATLAEGSTYTATYGAVPANYQVYSAAGSVPLYMTASQTSSTDGLVFSPQCGVLRVRLTDASHDIMRVEVSDADGNTYRVTSLSAVDIASETKFYIALPAGTYTSLNIYDNNWQVASKTGISLAVVTGHVKPAANTSALTFTDCTTKGFRGTHAVVQLWADGPFWAENNIGADTPEDYGQYFAWGYTTAYSWTGSAWNPSGSFDVTSFPGFDTHPYSDMAAATWGAGFTVPTPEQLDTLVNFDHLAISPKSYDKCSVSNVTEGVAGIRVTGTTEGYKSNSIFLPAAGVGIVSSLQAAGSGCAYWSSVDGGQKSKSAFNLMFLSEAVAVAKSNKYQGYQVRPVYKVLYAEVMALGKYIGKSAADTKAALTGGGWVISKEETGEIKLSKTVDGNNVIVNVFVSGGTCYQVIAGIADSQAISNGTTVINQVGETYRFETLNKTANFHSGWCETSSAKPDMNCYTELTEWLKNNGEQCIAFNGIWLTSDNIIHAMMINAYKSDELISVTFAEVDE